MTPDAARHEGAGATALALACFGKTPTCADFVRAGGQPALLGALDTWLADTMRALAADVRWKLRYDAMQPLRFAFVGPAKRHAIAGYLVASRDRAQRRFPFVLATVLEPAEPAAFAAHSPLLLAPLWNHMEQHAFDLLRAPDGAALGAGLAAADYALADNDGADAALAGFMQATSVAELDALLAQAGFGARTAALMLALGVLFEPVGPSGVDEIEKNLVLPLPDAPRQRWLVAAFWLQLLLPFLRHGDFELALLFPQGAPVLVLGLAGASPQTLQTLLDPYAAQQHNLKFERLDWLTAQCAANARLRQLGCYLDQGSLTLAGAHEHFRQTFPGG